MNVLAIDIGGTAIKYAEMTDDLEILSKGKVPTPLTGQEDLIEVLTKIHGEYPSEMSRQNKIFLLKFVTQSGIKSIRCRKQFGD